MIAEEIKVGKRLSKIQLTSELGSLSTAFPETDFVNRNLKTDPAFTALQSVLPPTE